ncbi:MAG: M14 family zinc carboxypeptidase, partial [Verrucomicrobiota bacterium]
MKPILLFLALLLPWGASQAAKLEYFLPEGADYNPSITRPSAYLGYEIGDWHIRYDQLVGYLKTLSEESDRFQFEEIGRTYEERSLIMLTISDPGNLGRLEALREAHLRLCDPLNSEPPAKDVPVVVNMGYGVHGDESSASNAAVVLAYHLAAARDEATNQLLKRAIILLDPCLNPDGLSRFANWANSNRGKKPVADAIHREHRAVWPGGRTNHYWFDLNRDWLLAQHPESHARLVKFHQWRPNVLTDFHEMASESTYFFQPGVPARKHPLTPEANVKLTERFAEYHARALDKLGSLYYTQERFDD